MTGPGQGDLTRVKALLFDLDGTLLGNDTEAFLQHYVPALAGVAGHHVPPERFVAQLLCATEAMIKSNDPTTTNEEVFAAAFYEPLGLVRAEWEPRFARFYAEDYPALSRLTGARPAARRVLDLAQARGHALVVATNPVFPRVALMERLRWAKVADYPWDLITDYETMHHCKPSLGYYHEIAALIGRRPDQCLMIGNDVEEDMVAGRTGMLTFLETSQPIQRRPGPTGADFAGTLDELYQLLSAVPRGTSP